MCPLRRILIATDAWRPQVNGVVRTLETTQLHLEKLGHAVEVVHPSLFTNFPTPFYPEIRLSIPWQNDIVRRITSFDPDAIHIATEGPIGFAVRTFCRRRRWHYTTSYHTRFPEYLRRLVGVPEAWSYRYMRWFHGSSAAIMVATPSLETELRERGFTSPLLRWSRGVDLELFHPRAKTLFSEYSRPILLYAGRVSKEKGLDDFLALKTPGTKVIVGDGPYRTRLESKYRDAVFLGYRNGEALAQTYSSADLFVFPSKTDTFGLVIVEALASGLPVAAYPVVGPIDIVNDAKTGALNDDLATAIACALKDGDPDSCVRLGRQYTWSNCTRQFLGNIVNAKTGHRLTNL